MEKMEISKENRKAKFRLRFAKKVQENQEQKIWIREYDRHRYANDPVFADKIKAKRREVYNLKKETKLTA